MLNYFDDNKEIIIPADYIFNLPRPSDLIKFSLALNYAIRVLEYSKECKSFSIE